MLIKGAMRSWYCAIQNIRIAYEVGLISSYAQKEILVRQICICLNAYDNKERAS